MRCYFSIENGGLTFVGFCVVAADYKTVRGHETWIAYVETLRENEPARDFSRLLDSGKPCTSAEKPA